jgi:hypothetical protein
MQSNLVANFRVYGKHCRALGEAKGLAKGEAKGKVEGLATGKGEALVRLLVSRFGTLPRSFRQRIRGAKLATIERWFDLALDACDLRSVFERSR